MARQIALALSNALLYREAARVDPQFPSARYNLGRLLLKQGYAEQGIVEVQEALRLYPPAWGFSRLALADDWIGNYRVPTGSLVFIIPFVVHLRPPLWPDPERFDPERFTADRAGARPKFSYLPFGGGPRQCIGNQFAMVETTLILAMIAQRYEVQLTPGQRIASVGRTGRATNYHVHFEIRRDGRVYNPLYMLPMPGRVAHVDETDDEPDE